jgi:putative ABC transport system permease protein
VNGLAQDLRYALRSLRSRPLLVLVTAAILALGIGASTAIFSVVDAVLLRPLPFAAPDKLLMVWMGLPEQNQPFIAVPYSFVQVLRTRARSLAAVAAMPEANSGFLVSGGEPVRIQGRLVTGNFFDVLGARALRGRTFTESEDRVGTPRVIVISHGLWQRQFGGDPELVGRTLVVDGTPMTVIGVMPPDFRYPPGAELWTPVVPIIPAEVANPAVAWAVVVARMAEGSSITQVRAEMDTIRASFAQEEKWTGPIPRPVLTPLAEHLVGRARPALLVLLLAVLLVLLVACANVAALLLARAGARQREIAVRLALGASRGRLARQLLAESALIAGAGGLAGIALAVWTLDALVALVPAQVPRLADAAVDGRVLAFALALALASSLLAGLAPALLASKPELTETLGAGARMAGPGRHHRLRALLVASEMAVAVVLLSGAGLLVRTFQNLRHVDLGFDPRHVLAIELSGTRDKYPTAPQRHQLTRTLVERIDGLPGVEAAAAVLVQPLSGHIGYDWPYRTEEQSEEDARHNPPLNLQVVTPGFFQTMRMPLLRGRTFTDRDRQDAPPVVVVSQALARRQWPGQDPVGKRVQVPATTAPYAPTWLTIVGVVGESRYRDLQAVWLDLYLPHLQSEEGLGHMVVRTQGDPVAVAGAVREAVKAVDDDLLLSGVTTMETALDTARGGARFGMQLLSGFAVTALVLAALGTYGVLAFMVGGRTREIGLRMALGARAADVLGLVLGQGLKPVAAGLAVGMAGSLALGRALSTLLFGVAPHDALTMAGAAAVLAAAAVAACYVPARRAAHLDPAAALRRE